MAKLTILGIGNILMRDEGIGVRILEPLRAARPWPAGVEFIDGGVGGLNLLTVIEAAEAMVVLDAAEMNLPAGEVRVISPEQVARECSQGRLSLHEAPFVETLRLCEQFSRRPGVVRILAVQPGAVEYGRELSQALSARLDGIVQAAAELVADTWRQVNESAV
jgi:hydrogenase maturation protease